MTLPVLRSAHAVPPHFDPEPFSDAAFAQLSACPLVAPGICANPVCSRPFAPSRSWQQYCCTACKVMDAQEMRRIGHKAAPALLAWRAGKYEKTDQDLRALSRAGRNYVSRLSSEWWFDRMRRAGNSRDGGQING